VNAESNFADPILLNKEADAKSYFADPILLNKEAEGREQSKPSMRSISSPMSSSPPMSSATRTPSPPRNIAARTLSPPTVIEALNDPFTRNVDPLHIHMMSWQVDADDEAEETLIRNGSAVTQEDCAGHAERRQKIRRP
jgi:hypothetical protein